MRRQFSVPVVVEHGHEEGDLLLRQAAEPPAPYLEEQGLLPIRHLYGAPLIVRVVRLDP